MVTVVYHLVGYAAVDADVLACDEARPVSKAQSSYGLSAFLAQSCSFHSLPFELCSNSITTRQCSSKLDIALAALSFHFFTLLVILFTLSCRRLCQRDLHYGSMFKTTCYGIVKGIHVFGKESLADGS